MQRQTIISITKKPIRISRDKNQPITQYIWLSKCVIQRTHLWNTCISLYFCCTNPGDYKRIEFNDEFIIYYVESE